MSAGRGRRARNMGQQADWPEGVFARYQTVVGATVDLTGGGDKTYSRCTGCHHDKGSDVWSAESVARRHAQAHAETCRALPRPEPVR